MPSEYLLKCLDMLKPLIRNDSKILSCTKGLYENLKTPTELIREKLNKPVATLIGPNLSAEIIAGAPAVTSIAGEYAEEWTVLLSSKNFTVVTAEESVVLEFGGAVKNVIALGVGLIKGYYHKNYYNIIGGFVAFMLKEMESIYGRIIPPLVIGDLFSTAMSETSRNYKYGFSSGMNLKNGIKLKPPAETVEGYNTLRTINVYVEERKIKAPVTRALFKIFFEKGKVEDLVTAWHE